MIKIKDIIFVGLCTVALVSGTAFISQYVAEKETAEKQQTGLDDVVFEPLSTEVSTTEATTEATTETTTEATVEEQPQNSDELMSKETASELIGSEQFKAALANSKCVGGIVIKDTNIDYNIMQDKTDNEYYLHHDNDGNESVSGSVYLDANHSLVNDALKVVYGHNMRKGTMFHDIIKFRNDEFLGAHQDITVWAKEGDENIRFMKYKPIYCYADVADGSYIKEMYDPSEAARLLSFKTGQNLADGDYMVLITCSYGQENERTYLICRKK